MHSKFYASLFLLGGLMAASAHGHAQVHSGKTGTYKPSKTAAKPNNPKDPDRWQTDVAFTFVEEKTEFLNQGYSSWVKGGSADIGVSIWHGIGLAGNITGEHSPDVVHNIVGDPPGSYDLGKFSYAVGPRYTFDASRYTSKLTGGRSVRVFGQFLFGATHSFNTYLPYTIFRTPPSTYSAGNPYAYETTNDCTSKEVGGGIDVRVWRNISVRPIQGSWIQNHVPDGNKNVQGSVRLSAGVTFHLRPKS